MKKTITLRSSFSELSRVANCELNIHLSRASIGYELWKGDAYKGGFHTLPAVAAELITLLGVQAAEHERIQDAEVREAEHEQAIRDEKQAPFRAAENRLQDADSAAVMVAGKVKGYCKAIRGTRSIAVCAERAMDGSPVNIRQLRVSFSNKLLAFDLPNYSAFVFNNEIYYVAEPQHSDE